MTPLVSTIDPTFAFQNLVEASFGFAIGVAFLIAAAMKRLVRARLLGIAVTLVIFGASDIVESRTGAWWRPWWLLVWKATCVAALGWFAWRYYRGRSGTSGPQA